MVVVFDDDNVPSSELPSSRHRLMQEYPFVGVWGPGNVDVELLDPVPASLQQRVKAHHGQKKSQSVQYALGPCGVVSLLSNRHGTGHPKRRGRELPSCGGVRSTQRHRPTRRAASASAGDCQIVWQAINMGLAAGSHPDLRLLHLIPGSRSTMKYLRRLMFGCAISHYRARAQSFPPQAEAWRRSVPTLPRYGMQVSKVVDVERAAQSDCGSCRSTWPSSSANGVGT